MLEAKTPQNGSTPPPLRKILDPALISISICCTFSLFQHCNANNLYCDTPLSGNQRLCGTTGSAILDLQLYLQTGLSQFLNLLFLVCPVLL